MVEEPLMRDGVLLRLQAMQKYNPDVHVKGT